MLLRFQYLHYDICQVVIGRNVAEFQFSSGVKVPAVVELHIDVLVPAFPISSCLDDLQCTIGIGVDGERISISVDGERIFEFPDDVRVKLGKPLGFSSGF